MKRILPAALMVLFLKATSAPACLWYEGTTLEGHLRSVAGHQSLPEAGLPIQGRILYFPVEDPHAAKPVRGSFVPHLRWVLGASPAALIGVHLPKQRSGPSDWPSGLDDAIRPVFEGKPADAEARLRKLLESHPENYFICADLAVVLELQARPAEALVWVNKAIQMRPDAHSGTEWIHAAFLKARIAIAENPDWLDTHTVSGIPVSGDIPKDLTLRSGDRVLDLEKIHESILAHAIPRMLFVKGTDELTGAMLAELARVEAQLISVEAGLDMLKFASEMGAQNTESLQKDWISLGLREGKRFRSDPQSGALIYGPLFAVPILVAMLAYVRSSRKRRTGASRD